jgi:hypothetical protein
MSMLRDAVPRAAIGCPDTNAASAEVLSIVDA